MSGARAACAKLIHLPGRWGMRPAWSSTCLREGGGRGDQCQDVSLEPDSMPVTIVPSETGPSRPSGPSKIRKQLQHLDRTRLPTVPALSAWRPSPQGWSAVLEGRASPAAGAHCRAGLPSSLRAGAAGRLPPRPWQQRIPATPGCPGLGWAETLPSFIGFNMGDSPVLVPSVCC